MAPITLAFALALVLVTAAAFIWGGRDERAVAAGYLLAYLASRASQGTFDFAARTWLLVAVDVLLLAWLAWVAIRSDRTWVVISAALQLLLVFGYLARWVDPSLLDSGYWVLLTASSFPTLGLLAIGIAQTAISRRWRAERPSTSIATGGRRNSQSR